MAFGVGKRHCVLVLYVLVLFVLVLCVLVLFVLELFVLVLCVLVLFVHCTSSFCFSWPIFIQFGMDVMFQCAPAPYLCCSAHQHHSYVAVRTSTIFMLQCTPAP
jgi:hypothetical protein